MNNPSVDEQRLTTCGTRTASHTSSHVPPQNSTKTLAAKVIHSLPAQHSPVSKI